MVMVSLGNYNYLVKAQEKLLKSTLTTVKRCDATASEVWVRSFYTINRELLTKEQHTLAVYEAHHNT